jgi:hypothetical protein
MVLESTGVYWKPVWHVLEGQCELILANALHIRNIPGRKSDVNDATWIADLLAHGLIRGSATWASPWPSSPPLEHPVFPRPRTVTERGAELAIGMGNGRVKSQTRVEPWTTVIILGCGSGSSLGAA